MLQLDGDRSTLKYLLDARSHALNDMLKWQRPSRDEL